MRRGFTLLELLAALTVLAIATSVATLAMRIVDRPPTLDPRGILADSLHAAIEQQRTIRIALPGGDSMVFAAANADGSVVADSAFDVDRLSGRFNHARR